MADEDLPPQARKTALYAAGGGFGGALLAILIAKLLAGPCCCPVAAPAGQYERPAAVSSTAPAAGRPVARVDSG